MSNLSRLLIFMNLPLSPLLSFLPHSPTYFSQLFTSSPDLPLRRDKLFSQLFHLIPRPLLPGEKGSKDNIIRFLASLPWERGWGMETCFKLEVLWIACWSILSIG
jgi:hypothetical protein